MRGSGARGLVGMGLALGGAMACGPSFQAIYEGDVRFEHCYALDQSPFAADVKKECWRDWLHGYTYGQSRDRVEYAGTRFSELSLDPTLPSEDVKHPRPMAVPMPTNAFAPPPSIAEHPAVMEAVPTASVPRMVAAHAPGEDCAENCAGYWKTCKSGCKDGACDACDKAYRLCVPGCFKR
jgi:hypothetical protein